MAVRSQRLRRAITCMKRKEREEGEGGESDSEEEVTSPSKSKKGKAADKSAKSGEVEKPVSGGGFLGSAMTVEPPLTSPEDVSATSEVSASPKAPQPVKTPSHRARKSSSSSSSGDDSDTAGEVSMVTARSVFEGSLRGRGRGRGSKRGRGSTRGKGRGKKV